MNIGVLKERKRDERRVALRPDQIRSLVEEGHAVWVERNAGEGAGFGDEVYVQAGAAVVDSDDVYDRATLLLKVKCPLPEEYGLLQSRHVLFAYLHFDENIPAANIQKIVETGVTAIAYEWVEENGRFPLLQPMSELSGAVFARQAMHLLIKGAGLLGGAYQSGWPAARAMVIGAGHMGSNAINVLVRNRFQLVIVDKHPETLASRLQGLLPDSWTPGDADVIRFDESRPEESAEALRRRLPETDIVLSCAVRRPTLPKERCEYLIRRNDVARMRKNGVICDGTACNHDLIETGVSSDSLTETYVEEGVTHYNCDHIPALVPATSPLLLTQATFPFVRLLALGFEEAIRRSAALARGVMGYRGRLTHAYSATKKHLPYTELSQWLRG